MIHICGIIVLRRGLRCFTGKFADAFNYYLFGGEQVIDSSQLCELDIAELAVPYGREKKGGPAEIPSVDFGKFHTSLGDVLEFIKYLGNKEEMSAWLKGPGTQVSFGQKEVEVLNACVNAKLKAREEEETIMVKTSFDLLLEEESMKAAQQFVGEMAGKIALELAEKVGKETAEKAEKEKAKAIRVTSERIQLEGIRNLMKNLHMTAEQAIAALGISGEDKKKLMSKL